MLCSKGVVFSIKMIGTVEFGWFSYARNWNGEHKLPQSHCYAYWLKNTYPKFHISLEKMKTGTLREIIVRSFAYKYVL